MFLGRCRGPRETGQRRRAPRRCRYHTTTPSQRALQLERDHIEGDLPLGDDAVELAEFVAVAQLRRPVLAHPPVPSEAGLSGRLGGCWTTACRAPLCDPAPSETSGASGAPCSALRVDGCCRPCVGSAPGVRTREGAASSEQHRGHSKGPDQPGSGSPGLGSNGSRWMQPSKPCVRSTGDRTVRIERSDGNCTTLPTAVQLYTVSLYSAYVCSEGASMRFVGRQDEMSWLDGELARADRGGGRLVAVRGRRQVGKSRLLT